jgi:copper transporter 1
MMTPYFHFTIGDSLFLQAWKPRWLAATRGIYNTQWHQRTFDLTKYRDLSVTSQRIASNSKTDSTETPEPVETGVQEINRQRAKLSALSTGPQFRTVKFRMRTIPPFIAAHDIPRGILYAAQMLVSYLLMLAIMTFQAAYFISIVLGLGIGETIFGRAGTMDGGH